MKSSDPYVKIILQIVEENPQFPKEAYFFVQDAVSYTLHSIEKNKKRHCRHITGQQLSEGIRKYLLEQFGPMAIDVLKEWGITTTRDFGTIVFNMIQYNVLSARKEDSIEDFYDNYDFNEEFVVRFLLDDEPIEVPLIA